MNTNCSICLEEIKEPEYLNLPCNHPFHKKCINGWLKNNNNCPNCRSILVPNVVIQINSDNSDSDSDSDSDNSININNILNRYNSNLSTASSIVRCIIIIIVSLIYICVFALIILVAASLFYLFKNF